MFNKSFKCRIDGFSAGIRRQSGNNEGQSYVQMHLLFELTSEIASEIGGPAPRVFELLSNGGDAGTVGAIPIRLNSRAVNVRFRVGNKHHIISETIALSLRAMPPNRQNVSPMLEVRVSFLGGPNDITMLWDNMGRQISLRMDREQLELPGMGPVIDDEDDQVEMEAMQ